jgi:multiple sugar transport system permease protein
LALLLSGFFMRRGWWTKTYCLSSSCLGCASDPGYISIHWMLNGQWGLVNNVIWSLWQTDGPPGLTTQI